MTDLAGSGRSTITLNRRARYDYDIVESVEAGLVLTGTEIKSIRGRRVSISDAYARPNNGEMWLYNLHIDEYTHAHRNNHDPKRPRKLLLNRDQITKLARQVDQRGLTLIPVPTVHPEPLRQDRAGRRPREKALRQATRTHRTGARARSAGRNRLQQTLTLDISLAVCLHTSTTMSK